MIQSNTLRIGNLVQHRFWNPEPGNERVSYSQCTIHALGQDKVAVRIKDNSILKIDYEDLEPIEITEEILLRMGFEIINSLERYPIFKKEELIVKLGAIDWWTGFEGMKLSLVNIKHAHQLQNLAFALGLEEVTFKDLTTKN